MFPSPAKVQSTSVITPAVIQDSQVISPPVVQQPVVEDKKE